MFDMCEDNDQRGCLGNNDCCRESQVDKPEGELKGSFRFLKSGVSKDTVTKTSTKLPTRPNSFVTERFRS